MWFISKPNIVGRESTQICDKKESLSRHVSWHNVAPRLTMCHSDAEWGQLDGSRRVWHLDNKYKTEECKHSHILQSLCLDMCIAGSPFSLHYRGQSEAVNTECKLRSSGQPGWENGGNIKVWSLLWRLERRGSEHYSGPGHNPLLYEDGAISELFRDMETDRDLSST